MQNETRPDGQTPQHDEIVRQIMKAIAHVRFGQVQIIIQDSRVVQIDTTEKNRLA